MAVRSTSMLGWLLLTLNLVAPAAQPDEPKRVLILHSSTYNSTANVLRRELKRELADRLDLYEEWLISARFSDEDSDEAFASYLTRLFANHPVDLTIAVDLSAVNFVHKYEQRLFHSAPVLFTDVEAQNVSGITFAENETVLAFSRNLTTVIAGILRVLPKTTTLVVVIGNSATDQLFAERFRQAARPFENHLKVAFLTGPRFDDVLRQVATLPPGSVIYPVLNTPSISGIPPDNDDALAQLHSVANAPIFYHWDFAFGRGLVGGPMISHEPYGRQAATVAARLLHGEAPANIRLPPVQLGNPRFDWRELRRWHIKEADLPPGSEISFREPSAWDRYRSQVLSAIALILIEAGLILALFYERRRRRKLQIEVRGRLSELAHMNRRLTVGELSASIAHELQQPLTAILCNTEAAELILSRMSGAGEVMEILTDIRRDNLRASEVIRRLRRLLTKTSPETEELNLNDVVGEVFELLADEAAARRVTFSTSFAMPPPRVQGDRIQLQQVVLNLAMNALDAISGANSVERIVIGRTALINDDSAEISIEDSGPGIPTGKTQQLFEPFFTTKEGGMGMGLSIARSIVEGHGGRIWAEARRDGRGAVFHLSLALAHPAATTELRFDKSANGEPSATP